MKTLRTGRAAKQDAVFTYTPAHDALPKALTPAEELLLRRIEAPTSIASLTRQNPPEANHAIDFRLCGRLDPRKGSSPWSFPEYSTSIE
jgi:hypothetical protein